MSGLIVDADGDLFLEILARYMFVPGDRIGGQDCLKTVPELRGLGLCEEESDP